MLKRLSLGIVAASVVAAVVSPVTGTAAVTTAAPSSDKRGVTLTASATDVEEGSRLTLTAKVKDTAKDTRVTLQRWVAADGKWEDVKRKTAKGKPKVKFKVVATALNSERFRAKVKHDGRSSKSKELEVTVWRWIPLGDYPPYYQSSGVGFGQVTINGHAYDGWVPRTYSHAGAWESKFTPGRNCQSFRGVVGLSDSSDDGSSGVVKVTAEDAVVYVSPTLTPGMDVLLTLPIALPYRLGLQASDTSTGPLESWPAVGDPALLCTGID